MVVLALVLPVGAMLPWKRAGLLRALKPLWGAGVLAVALAALAWAIQAEKTALGPIGVFLGTWLVAGAAVDFWSRTGRGALSGRFARLARLPGADWGKMGAHAGLGIVFIGISGLMAWQVEDIRTAQVGESFEVAGYTITLTDVRDERGKNWVATVGTIRVEQGGRTVAILEPEKRVYPVQAMPTTEAAIANGLWRDVYMVIGDPQAGGGWAIRTFIKPFANWIWAGSILMALGGLVSLFDRRFRVAAGAARSKAVGVPAE
jgi:cytochrome c-type biogenesis protein CcmF